MTKQAATPVFKQLIAFSNVSYKKTLLAFPGQLEF